MISDERIDVLKRERFNEHEGLIHALLDEITTLRKVAEAADWFIKYGNETPNSSKVLIAEALKEWRGGSDD